ncbi:hypothetical protein MSAN_00214500 [Mycena sanguinolenta]|uniref:Uncharacterized protein n=1 Tax=Mycena sanguinolenta TaxID=230812 RepID=A0A8H7DMK9_9AGAR|nr:hypothetical protein MSAN_00214500 [Mycena sanguinolenta]
MLIDGSVMSYQMISAVPGSAFCPQLFLSVSAWSNVMQQDALKKAKANVLDANNASTVVLSASKRTGRPIKKSANGRGPTPTLDRRQLINPDGSFMPMSYNLILWDPMFGYTSANPETVYKDLVNAYRVLRLGAHLNASRVSSALREIDFKEWMERVVRAQMLPEWWDAEWKYIFIEDGVNSL